MPLNKDQLVEEFRKFMDPDFEIFEGSPANTAEFADKFSKAISAYAAAVTPPTNPATLPAATAALNTALLAVKTIPGNRFTDIITPAMITFAGVIGVGMGTVSGGTVAPLPPVGPLGMLIFTTVLPLGLPPSSQPASVCIDALATTIDGWFRTGTAAVGGAAPTVWS